MSRFRARPRKAFRAWERPPQPRTPTRCRPQRPMLAASRSTPRTRCTGSRFARRRSADTGKSTGRGCARRPIDRPPPPGPVRQRTAGRQGQNTRRCPARPWLCTRRATSFRRGPENRTLARLGDIHENESQPPGAPFPGATVTARERMMRTVEKRSAVRTVPGQFPRPTHAATCERGRRRSAGATADTGGRRATAVAAAA